MIEIRIERNSAGQVEAFAVTGHAGYAEAGQDIVCAGVSAITLTTVLGLENVLGIECAGKQRDGRLICRLPRMPEHLREKADLLLTTMIVGLQAVKESYADYVRIVDPKEV